MGVMGDLFAADSTPATGGSDQLIVMIGGVVVAAIGALATVLVAVVNSRSNRTTPSPPPADPGVPHAEIRALRDAVADLAEDIVFVRERTAVHGQQIVDLAEANDVQDRRLEQIELAKDQDHPGWRARF